MEFKVVIQVRKDTGERHVAFSPSPIISIEEMILTAPGWENSKIIFEHVTITASPEVEAELAVAELRSIPDALAGTLSDAQQVKAAEILEQHYHSELQ